MAALCIGLLVPAADAATSTVSYNGLPSDWAAKSTNCSTFAESSYAPSHVLGPATPPAGQGSLKVSATAGTTQDLTFGWATSDIPMSQVTAFSGDVYVPNTGGLAPEVTIVGANATPTTAPTALYLLRYTPTGTDSWVPFDATTATLTWDTVDLSSGTYSNIGSGTLAAFNTQYPNLEFGFFDISPHVTDASQCVAGSFNLDDVHYAVGTNDNTVDFEAPAPTTFTNGSHPSSVLTGTAVTLSATLKSNGTPLTGQSVRLYAKATGSSTYKLVTTLTTDATTGAVSMRVGPKSTTSYQWRFASSGSNPYAPANASAFTIVTRQRVAITSKPTSVLYRGTAVIKGRVTPYRSGVTVRLVRLVSGKRILVASARTGTGGYFTIKALMTVRGTYSYVVTAAAYTGEAQGQSSSFRIATR